MIARGIAGRIALAAIASAAVGLVILAVGVAVVGADVFTALMMEAGDSAEHAREMYDQSVTGVVIAASVVAVLASVGLAIVLARMLARPAGSDRSLRRGASPMVTTRLASRARGPRNSPASPIPSTRWPPRSSSRNGCVAISSRTPPTSCAPR